MTPRAIQSLAATALVVAPGCSVQQHHELSISHDDQTPPVEVAKDGDNWAATIRWGSTLSATAVAATPDEASAAAVSLWKKATD